MSESKLGPNSLLLVMAGVFLAAYFIPWESGVVSGALVEGFAMLGDYAREHVLLCLIPAFFIAGAIAVFLNQRSVIRYLGPSAPRPVAYGVAAVSGAILAVCSCTVLPLFKGIYKKGAGLGPAISFLYSGPAISVLAVVFSFQVFGPRLGTARLVGAVAFSVVIGLAMALIYRKEDSQRTIDERMFKAGTSERPLWQTALTLGSMIAILVFLNWASSRGVSAIWDVIHQYRFWIAGFFGVILALTIWRWYAPYERESWVLSSRDFALQILPLLFGGVLIAGFLLGRPGHQGLIPNEWVSALVGGNSLWANLFASVAGAFMYFATLTEVPIVQGLLGSGMGQGPALALLLAGPSLSLPSMLVILGELGWKKTVTYVILVISLSTLAGWAYGNFF